MIFPKKASPYGGGVGEADGGGSDQRTTAPWIDDPRTPPTDRYAIASPTGGGFYYSRRKIPSVTIPPIIPARKSAFIATGSYSGLSTHWVKVSPLGAASAR